MQKHPNWRLWENYHAFGQYRGELTRQIIGREIDLKQARILDLGCGTGATALAFAPDTTTVFSADVDLTRFRAQKRPTDPVVKMSAQNLGFKSASFEAVILQDVLEHLPEPAWALTEIRRVLKPDGRLYLTTPNRCSILNFVSDPHWNLPLVAAGSRKVVRFLVSQIFRREALQRTDFAALLSWFRLKKLLETCHFQHRFIHKTILRALFETPRAVVCSPLHLQIVAGLQKFRFQKLLEKIVSDRPGWFNSWVNPTWFIIGKKID